MPRTRPAWRPLDVRIIGRRLPGRRFGTYDAVHLGVQRGAEVVDLVPGDADAATFAFSLDVATGADDGLDFRGPYVHGRCGERFVYLSWGELGADGHFAMFRRAKLHLTALGADDVERALTTGTPLVATLDLTDARGGPLCASVRPPLVEWRVAPG